MNTITMPDFEGWALALMEDYIEHKDACVYTPGDIECALRQAFNQGHSLGYRDGSETIEPGHRGAY